MSQLEPEPVMRMKGADGEFDITPSNGILYRYIGANAVYDHVFMKTGETEDGEREGHLIFMRGFLEDGSIAEVTAWMVNRGYESHLNVMEPQEIIKAVHAKVVERQTADIPDTLPEGWE